MKVKGLKKAVGEFRRANAEGPFSPRYGLLMLDAESGELWTDCFCSLGHNEWKDYHDPAVIDLSIVAQFAPMSTIKSVAEDITSAFDIALAKCSILHLPWETCLKDFLADEDRITNEYLRPILER